MEQRTGDIFVDNGLLALAVVEQALGSEQAAIAFVIDLYLEQWTTTLHAVFPNSMFVNPAFQGNRRQALLDFYLTVTEAEAVRSRIILGGSHSFLNFSPSLVLPVVSRRTLLGHLFCPLACFRFKADDRLWLLQCADTAFMQAWVEIMLTRSLTAEGPLSFQHRVYPFMNRLYAELNSRNQYWELLAFTNYGPRPSSEWYRFSANTVREQLLLEFRQARDKYNSPRIKHLWEAQFQDLTAFVFADAHK